MMKINPVKNPKKPDYPDLNELSRKKKSKKLVAFLAALASLATTLTGCQVQGDVAYEGVAMPPVETEEQLAGDVAIDGGMEIETCEVDLMGETVVDTVFVNQYKFSDNGKWIFDTVITDEENDIEYLLDDGRRIKFYSGDLLVVAGATPDEIFDSEGYGEYIKMYPDMVFADDKVFYTADGDTILIPDYNNHYVVFPKKEDEEIVTLAGDVIYTEPEIAGGIVMETEIVLDTELAGKVLLETTEDSSEFCEIPEE